LSNLIRSPKDFWPGVIFVTAGLAAITIARDYVMGSTGRMGPAYFPTVLGGMLAILGAVCIARALVRSGEPIGRIAIRELGLILGATVMFGLLVRGAGLAVAILVLVMASGLASTRFKVAPYLGLAVALAAFCVLVFVKGLGLPMPFIGPWLAR
jgi:putative tricarboxylic transport membrane protein